MSPSDAIVLRTLRRAAEVGARCPSNSELTEAAKLTNKNSMTAVLNRLERAGQIMVIRRSNIREVTIAATGKVTSSMTKASMRRYTARQLADVPPARVFRDPCPRCAVRPEVGCSHGWTGEYFAQVAA